MSNIIKINKDMPYELKQDLIETFDIAISLVESSPELPCFLEEVDIVHLITLLYPFKIH